MTTTQDPRVSLPPARSRGRGRGPTYPVGRVVAVVLFAAVAFQWVRIAGIPEDPVQMFVWLWLAAIAFRWGVPVREHLAFPRDWWPVVAMLLFYTYTRGLADDLGIAAHVSMPISVDRWLGGGELPTQRLQDALCTGSCADLGQAQWYDTLFTLTYVTHFVAGLVIAIVLWLRSRPAWVAWMRRYLALNVAGLVIYVVYPMVPPWMASEQGALSPGVDRLTGRGSPWGLHLSQLLGSGIGNPVAAMPSLHAGTTVLIALYGVQRLRSSWRWLLLLYPVCMSVTLVYFGEHYVVDCLAGAALAVVVLVGCNRWERRRRTRPVAGLRASAPPAAPRTTPSAPLPG